MEKMLIRGVTKDKDVAVVSVVGLDDNPALHSKGFFKACSEKYQC